MLRNNRNKETAMIEPAIMFICTAAAAAGPSLWINAAFTGGLVLSGLASAALCAILFRVTSGAAGFIGSAMDGRATGIYHAVGYIPFTFLVYKLIQGRDIAGLIHIHRGEALLNLPIIAGLYIVLFLVLAVFRRSTASSFTVAGLYFLFPFSFTVYLFPLLPSAEVKVMLGNIALIYFFLRSLTLPASYYIFNRSIKFKQ